MEVLVIVIVFVVLATIGVFVGIVIGTNRMKKAIEEGSVGYLRIDRSEKDEAPRPFLEISGTTIDGISHKDFVILKVINKDYLSRE